MRMGSSAKSFFTKGSKGWMKKSKMLRKDSPRVESELAQIRRAEVNSERLRKKVQAVGEILGEYLGIRLREGLNYESKRLILQSVFETLGEPVIVHGVRGMKRKPMASWDGALDFDRLEEAARAVEIGKAFKEAFVIRCLARDSAL
jgi:hypothetical protein